MPSVPWNEIENAFAAVRAAEPPPQKPSWAAPSLSCAIADALLKPGTPPTPSRPSTLPPYFELRTENKRLTSTTSSSPTFRSLTKRPRGKCPYGFEDLPGPPLNSRKPTETLSSPKPRKLFNRKRIKLPINYPALDIMKAVEEKPWELIPGLSH